MSTLKDPAKKWADEFYNHPYNRSGPYFTGVLFGMMYFEWMKSYKDVSFKQTIGSLFYNMIKNSSVMRYVLFFLSSVLMLTLILLPRFELHEPVKRQVSQIPSDIYNTFHKTIFVACLGVFLSGVMTGRMKFLKGALGGGLWAPWAKVTFTAYLLHVSVIAWCFLQTKGSIYITPLELIFYSYA